MQHIYIEAPYRSAAELASVVNAGHNVCYFSIDSYCPTRGEVLASAYNQDSSTPSWQAIATLHQGRIVEVA